MRHRGDCVLIILLTHMRQPVLADWFTLPIESQSCRPARSDRRSSLWRQVLVAAAAPHGQGTTKFSADGRALPFS